MKILDDFISLLKNEYAFDNFFLICSVKSYIQKKGLNLKDDYCKTEHIFLSQLQNCIY